MVAGPLHMLIWSSNYKMEFVIEHIKERSIILIDIKISIGLVDKSYLRQSVGGIEDRGYRQKVSHHQLTSHVLLPEPRPSKLKGGERDISAENEHHWQL